MTEKDDLVTRLHGPNGPWKSRDSVSVYTKTLNEAAARITALEHELAEAREALKPFAESAQGIDPTDEDCWLIWEHPQANSVSVGDFRRAARALTKPNASEQQ